MAEKGVVRVNNTTMAESSSSKRQKAGQNAGDDDIDRISNLPDSMLCHILSFLPTKMAVGTCVLSHRWHHVWEHLQVFDFYEHSHELYHEFELFKRFAVFVNSVLALRRARDIRKMRLSCCHSRENTFYSNSVSTWVRSAIGPHLEELRLTLNSSDGRGFVVPPTIFTCVNLVSLTLCGGIHVKRHRFDVHLPSLKMLQLDIDSLNTIDVILFGCPVLETLDLTFAPETLTKLHLPHSLKMFKLAIKNRIGTYPELDAPCLKYLNITQNTPCFPCSIGDLHNVEEACLDICAEYEPVNTLVKLLSAMPGIKLLALRLSTTKWLIRAPVLDIPQFHHLLALELTIPYFNSTFLMTMLHKCPMLQVLTIQNDQEPSLMRGWLPTSVPHCVAFRLTHINIRGFRGMAHELAFAAYILQRGLVLKIMIVSADIGLGMEDKYRILKILTVIPRRSRICQLRFD